jgi:hypothetical protein
MEWKVVPIVIKVIRIVIIDIIEEPCFETFQSEGCTSHEFLNLLWGFAPVIILGSVLTFVNK